MYFIQFSHFLCLFVCFFNHPYDRHFFYAFRRNAEKIEEEEEEEKQNQQTHTAITLWMNEFYSKRMWRKNLACNFVRVFKGVRACGEITISKINPIQMKTKQKWKKSNKYDRVK